MVSNGSFCGWESSLTSPYPALLSLSYVAIIIALFIGIAIVCDDYFVPSLEVICKRLDLSEDVAGATFMAAGSSAPELFTSLAAVTSSSDIGIGTIVGSAVFNILIIISLSGILCKQVLCLDWKPLTRDAVFYGVSIIGFSVFAWDGKFTVWESAVTLLYYFFYILAMKFNRSLFRVMEKLQMLVGRSCRGTRDINQMEANKEQSLGPTVHITPPTESQTSYYSDQEEVTYFTRSDSNNEYTAKGLHIPHSMNRTTSSGSSGIGSMTTAQTEEGGWMGDKDSMESVPLDAEKTDVESKLNGEYQLEVNISNECKGDDVDGEDDYDEIVVFRCERCPVVLTKLPTKPNGGCSGLRYGINILYFLTAFPFQFMFSFTIPNSTKSHLKRYYLLSFFMSVIWIAVLSFGMVFLVERFGCIVGFNDYVMGLVFVAAGTSVPDALSSVIVAREGHGDMAVSNALGSNVFDINLGLGLPFLIKCIYLRGDLILNKTDKLRRNIAVKPHSKFGLILLSILFIVYFLISCQKFRLTKPVGVSFILIYILFVGYSIVQEVVCHGYTC